MIDIKIGDCREVLKTLPSKSVDCCVTSPPYFGLRDYGEDNQIGLENTPDKYANTLVAVFKEVKRVLKDNGTLWLNLGDSYSGNNSRASNNGRAGYGKKREGVFNKTKNIPSKNLIGIPWRVAFALQNDGWILRQDIIWHKPNPLPESVKDRCTKSHEYIFLFSKKPRYYFNNEAIKKEAKHKNIVYLPYKTGKNISEQKFNETKTGKTTISVGDKVNSRSVWTVPVKPFNEAHFATYPPDLIEPCILAGCPNSGVVLDPFGGAGTTGLVADRLGRDSVLIELNKDYAKIADDRLHNDSPLFSEVKIGKQ